MQDVRRGRMAGPGWHQPHLWHHRQIQRCVAEEICACASERVLVRPSKAVGYRGEQEELLVLRKSGDGGVGWA
jgi:hypothetical protein